jgi:hypothetical protein
MLGQPFVMQQGQPQPAQPGQPEAKVIDLAAGEYAVAVTIGKSFTTRREEGSAQMGELAQAAPQMVPTFADLWVGNMDFPGARQIADRLKKTLPPQLQDNPDGENPEALKQQMQQLQQMLEMMTKELEGKTKLIETDGIKAQAKLQELTLSEQAENERTAAKIAAEERAKALDNLVKLAIAEINATKDAMSQHAEMAREELGFAHQHAESEASRQHESGESERDRQTAAEEAERARQAAMNEV